MAAPNDLDKALGQLLMVGLEVSTVNPSVTTILRLQAYGAVSDNELRRMVSFLKQDFPDCDLSRIYIWFIAIRFNIDVLFADFDLSEMFARLNQSLRLMALEVKSVVYTGMSDEGGLQRMLYHAIVNNVIIVYSAPGNYLKMLPRWYLWN